MKSITAPRSTAKQKASFAVHIGTNSSKLGCVNAAHRAGLFDRLGKHLGFCLSTPNAIRAAMHFFPTADFAQTRIPLFPTEFVYRNTLPVAQLAAAATSPELVAQLNQMNPDRKTPFRAVAPKTTKK